MVTVTGPPVVVLKVPLMLKLNPVRLIPVAFVVDTVPLKVLVPKPEVWVTNPAEISLAVTLVAELIVRLVRGTKPPTTPVMEMLPVPADRTKFLAPFRVLAKIISPIPAPVLRLTSAVSETGPANEMLRLFVVIDVPRWTAPVPACWNLPLRDNTMLFGKVAVPEFVMTNGPDNCVVTLPLNVKLFPVRLIPPTF